MSAVMVTIRRGRGWECDRGLGAVAFDDDLVKSLVSVASRGHRAEVVDDEDVDGGQAGASTGVVRRAARGPGEQFVGAGEQNGVSAADCVVAQRCCRCVLPTPTGPG